MSSEIAKVIGNTYRLARKDLAASVERLLECGRQLRSVKESLQHGEWELWLKEHQMELGFTPRTAQRLMKAANPTPASDLTHSEVIAISRSIWGHETDDGTGEDPEPVLYHTGRFIGFLKWIEKHDPEAIAPAVTTEQLGALRRWLDYLEILVCRRAA